MGGDKLAWVATSWHGWRYLGYAKARKFAFVPYRWALSCVVTVHADISIEFVQKESPSFVFDFHIVYRFSLETCMKGLTSDV